MPAFNFQSRFAAKVESGEKLHTIRAKRKHPPKAGQPFYAFEGMRTVKCRRLLCSWISCIEDVYIDSGGIISVGGRMLGRAERDNLATADGFVDAREFIAFFRDNHGLPFAGDLIHWKYKSPVARGKA